MFAIYKAYLDMVRDTKAAKTHELAHFVLQAFINHVADLPYKKLTLRRVEDFIAAQRRHWGREHHSELCPLSEGRPEVGRRS